MQNTINLDNLRTILNFLDKDSDLYNSQAEVCALVEQLENNSYTVYSRDFGNMSWKDECVALGVPHEAMEVKIGFLVKEIKLDTTDIAKRFCLDNRLIQNYGDGRYYYNRPENGINDMPIAHIEGDKVVCDINPIFPIGETFTLPYEEYEEDNVTHKTITETYTITGYDLSGCFAKGVVYDGDNGNAWIMESALIEQKAIAKIGEKFEVHFDYYEDGELTEHTITRIDFSKTESDEVVYWDDETSVYITESELLRYKASIEFTIVDEDLCRVVHGRYFPDNDDAERFLNESGACYTGGGKFYIENEDIGRYYRDKGFDAEFLARSAFCVQATLMTNESTIFLVHSNTLGAIMKDEITLTEELEGLISAHVEPVAEKQSGMNIGQLIAELQKLDQDKLVTIVVGDEDENIVDTRHFELHATDDGVEYLEIFVPVKI